MNNKHKYMLSYLRQYNLRTIRTLTEPCVPSCAFDVNLSLTNSNVYIIKWSFVPYQTIVAEIKSYWHFKIQNL